MSKLPDNIEPDPHHSPDHISRGQTDLPGFLPENSPENSPDSQAIERARKLLAAPPEHIGPYRILEPIGEGGMGTVYRARQDHPIKREVVLKLIKLGMDTKAVIARFEAERQALAMMNHPHIAKVFDAGTDETGRPYFVMEYVKGQSITTYADTQKLTLNDRLKLHQQVCEAIQHAHHKGVVHRDLKPSNVLVFTQDGKPFAKVIDFGIAKAMNTQLTDKTLFTQHQQMIGTPEYMSPEQADGNIDIDTRTDVYSLGVLLYELLTGQTPFDARRLRSAAYDAMVRIIREEEPPKPSVRLSTLAGSSAFSPVTLRDDASDPASQPDKHASSQASSIPTNTLATLAKSRSTDEKQFQKQVKGELDWLVMKAMDKDRSRRYTTPTDLSQDIERYLSGTPIVAAPPSLMYRARKFTRKHKRPLIAAAMLFAALVLGVSGTVYGLLKERRISAKMSAANRHVSASVEKVVDAILPDLSEIKAGDMITAFTGPNGGITAYVEQSASERKARWEISPTLSEDQRIMFSGELLEGFAINGIEGSRKARIALEKQLHENQRLLDAAELEAYIANLALAQAAMDNDNWPEARERLAACPESKRGWEWRFLDQSANEVIAHFPVDAYSVVFNKDGTYVLAKTDNELVCFDAEGTRVSRVPSRNGYAAAMFTPDGKAIVGSPDENNIQLYALDGTPASAQMTHGSSVSEVAFAADGTMVTLERTEKGGVQTYTARRWNAKGQLLGPPILDVIDDAFENGLLVTLTDDYTTEVFDFNGQRLIGPLKMGGSAITTAFNIDGAIHLLGYTGEQGKEKQLCWFDTNGKPVGDSMPHEGFVYEISLSSDKRHLLTVSNSANFIEAIRRNEAAYAGEARVWDLTGKPVCSPIQLDSRHLSTVTFSDDGQQVLVATGWKLQILDVAGNRLLDPIRLPGVACIARSGPDGAVLSTSGRERTTLQVWSSKGKLIGQYRTDQSNAGGLEVSSDGLVLMRSWSWGSGSARPTLLNPQHFDHRQFIEQNDERDLQIAWVMGTGAVPPTNRQTATTMPANVKSFTTSTMTPDGSRFLSTNDDRSIRIYETQNWRHLATVPVKSVVKQLRFSPDGTRLFINFTDGSAEIWDTRPYAERQADRDRVFAERKPAREYVQNLLKSDLPESQLVEHVKADASLSELRKVVVQEELDWELKRREAQRKRSSTSQPSTQPSTQPARDP